MIYRKITAVIILIAVMFSFSGCLPHTELDKQAIVEAIGIDYSVGEFEVSVQYFNAEGSGSSTLIDSTKANVTIVKGRGKKIQTAIESASAKCGRPFMFGTTAAIIFGKDAAEFDLVKNLSFAETYYQSNPKTLIAVADGKASDIMDVKFKDGAVSVDHLCQLIIHAQQLGISEAKPLYKVMNELRQPTGSTILPLLSAAQTKSSTTDDGTIAEINGGALFANKKLAAVISLSEVSGLQFLNGTVSNTSFSTTADNRNITVSLYSTKTELEPVFDGEKLCFNVKITALGKYIDSQLQDEGIPYSESVEKQCEELISTRITGAVKSAINCFGTDPVGLYHGIMMKNLPLWRTIREDYSELLKNAEFSVECKVEIDRFGVTH